MTEQLITISPKLPCLIIYFIMKIKFSTEKNNNTETNSIYCLYILSIIVRKIVGIDKNWYRQVTIGCLHMTSLRWKEYKNILLK